MLEQKLEESRINLWVEMTSGNDWGGIELELVSREQSSI